MLLIKGREAPHFLKGLSSIFWKKVGDFKKKDLKTLENQGLKIPRVYYIGWEEESISMKDFLANLTVDSLIVHDVPKKFAKKYIKVNPEVQSEDVILSDVPTKFDNELIRFFHDKISSTIGSTNAFEIELDSSLCDNNTQQAIRKYFNSDGVSSFPPNETKTIDITQDIAKSLYEVQSARNPGGILLFIPCYNQEKHGLAILKVEREDGVRIQQNMEQGKMTFDVLHIKDLMLTNKTKLFKIVLFYKDGENLIGFVCDRQQGVVQIREVANFFLTDFLGCKLKEEPYVSTKKFYNAVTTFINSADLTGSEKVDIRTHLISELTNNAIQINTLNFAQNYLPSDKAQSFMDKLREKKVPSSFPKDIKLIKENIKKVKYELESGIKIIGTEEAVKANLTVEPHDDGKTKFELIDHIRKVE